MAMSRTGFGTAQLVGYNLECHATNIHAADEFIRLCNLFGVTRVNFPNKKRNEDMLKWAKYILEKMPEASVVVHWSIKNQYSRTVVETERKFIKFCTDAEKIGVSEVLIVSGGGKRRKFDSVSVCQLISRSPKLKRSKLAFGACYNPYWSGGKLKEENARLRKKLKGATNIWLQTGSDAMKLQQGLNFLKEINFSGNVFGSIYTPSSQWLKQFSFRPWYGVFYSKEYLSNLDTAWQLTKNIIQVYKKNGVVCLLESKVKTAADHQSQLDQLGLP